MICYRDMTFCPFYDSCKNGDICDRAYTQSVKDAAMTWWGNDAPPVCLYTDKPDCMVVK